MVFPNAGQGHAKELIFAKPTDRNIILHRLKPLKQYIFWNNKQRDAMNDIFDDNKVFLMTLPSLKIKENNYLDLMINFVFRSNCYRFWMALKMHCYYHLHHWYHLITYFFNKLYCFNGFNCWIMTFLPVGSGDINGLQHICFVSLFILFTSNSIGQHLIFGDVYAV